MIRILMVHNPYQQAGGEDAVVEAETQLLAEHGHAVVRYERNNDELRNGGGFQSLRAGFQAVWASWSYREVKALIAKEKPDVAHFHNTFPLISPAAYYACAEADVPVVQTLHNYRLLCPSATFLRGGKVCEACLGKSVAWPGVVHGCYRDSRAATAAVGAMLATHKAMGTWKKKVDMYIALTEFARRKFVEGGLPEERIAVKPNFLVCDPGAKRGPGDYALYVGRLSEEKGPRVLMKAWAQLGGNIRLKTAGDGPLKEELVREIRASGLSKVELPGQVRSEEIAGLLHGARFLVLPSVWYECFPMTVAEAFACGVPVIASRLGSMAEIVADGKTGLHFTAGDDADLAAKVEWAWNHPEELLRMGRAARAEYEARYQPSKNYEMLMDIYRRAIAARAREAVARLAQSQVPEN
jgi:glycosyltransferase involved in cell wall biosynthesis